MNKEFVPYEQALALKELGFDEPCIARYYSQNKELPIFMQWTKAQDFNSIILPLPYTEEKISPFISAPLYQQAFRWFREKYNLKGFISPVEYLDDTADTYHWCIYNKCNSGNDQLTHEEAELECLKKLIQIIKEQDKNKYSEEDMQEAYKKGMDTEYNFQQKYIQRTHFKEWFEQFKKK